MAEPFLEDQLKRIRALTAHMSQVHSYSEHPYEARVDDANENPLFHARDYRMLSSMAEEPRAPRRRRRRRR